MLRSLFCVSSQAVAGRLTCRIVAPCLVITSVTPLPEYRAPDRDRRFLSMIAFPSICKYARESYR
jgi:hypothetical protein